MVFIYFSMRNVNAANYYINDGTYNGSDVYTTAVGNNANNGTAAATPKATLANLWATYGPAGTNVIANGDVIYVDAGTYTSASSAVGTCNCGFTFNVSITIQVAGEFKTIFDNNYVGIAGSYYFANITASVTLKKLQLKRYASNQNGQAVQISGTGAPGATLDHVITNNNGGSSKYAPIYIGSNSTVTITGGGSFCNGDAGHNASGGIDILGTSITVTITNHVFIGNYKSSAAAILNGAALTITGGNGTTSVSASNCLFSGNQTDEDGASGAAIYANSGALTLTDCILELNDTYELSTKYGGAAYFSGGTQQFTRVLVRNNTNSGGSTYGTVSVNGGALTLTNCYFSGNTSDWGKDVYCKAGSITATNTTFGSAANQMATYGGTIDITNCGTPTDQYSSGTYTDHGGAAPSFTTPTVPTYTGTCGSSNIALPISLISFSGKKEGRYNMLKWVTGSELDNEFFILEKTVDGVNYVNVEKKEGAGTSNEMVDYEVMDYNVEPVLNYYRLKQIDFNGKSTYSELISINNAEAREKEVVSITNLLGQEVNEQFRGFIIITYSDGSSLKMIR